MSNVDQINTTKANTLAQIAEVSHRRSPVTARTGSHSAGPSTWNTSSAASIGATSNSPAKSLLNFPHKDTRHDFYPDIADDCLLVDGTEQVTLHSTSVVSVAGAKRGLLTLTDMEFRQVGLESGDLVWIFGPAVSLGDVEPRQGDSVEDATGVFWTLLSAAKSPLSGVWRTVSRRQCSRC